MEKVRGHVIEKLIFLLALWAYTAAAPVEDTRCNTICYTIYTPICGTDGQTYANLCEMKIASCRQQKDITAVYGGKCQNNTCLGEHLDCANIYRPVCGSDGATYPSACELQVAKCQQVGKEELTIKYAGVCRNQEFPVSYPCDASRKCKTLFVPVCGTDSKTYTNVCLLGQENCKKSVDERVRLAYVGTCQASASKRNGDPCSEFETCTDDTRLVCGSDGKTYTNICQLRAANCSSSGVNITLAYNGPCENTQNKILSNPCIQNPNCGEIFEPVCGSDGKTYNHTCFLDSVNCNQTDIGKITIIHKGHCIQPKQDIKDPCVRRSNGCTRHYSAVCSSDGVTYNNECLFHEANCARAPGDRVTLVPLEKCET